MDAAVSAFSMVKHQGATGAAFASQDASQVSALTRNKTSAFIVMRLGGV